MAQAGNTVAKARAAARCRRWQALAKPGRKLSDAEVEKNIAREKAFENSFAAISKKMGDKLGRPVPAIGLFFQEPKQEEPKKEEPKMGAKAK